MRIVQYGVHDPQYPRNARIRAHLVERIGADVVVLRRPRDGTRVRRAFAEVLRLWRASRDADVVIVSEFRLTHAPVAWLVARLRGAQLVVDHFVGLHETVVEDWNRVPVGSVTARRLRAQDALAARIADVCLTDTAPRADRLGRLHGRPVLALPVGAPGWARPAVRSESAGDTLALLYYGNYLPLHGVGAIVDILTELAPARRFSATFIGSGAERAAVQAALRARGLIGHCRFVDAVPEAELGAYIGAADIVFGVFGDSRKALDVVPNKVWQGLACGRVTITGDGPAVRALQPVVGDQLVIVDRADPRAAARVLAAYDGPPASADDADLRLERAVRTAYESLTGSLRGGARS